MERLCKIRDIQRSIAQFEICFEKLYGISLNEGMALCSIDKTGSLSSGQLSDFLGLTCSNTSKVINSIEKKGLIQRVIGVKDKRQMFFSLTDKGKQLLKDIKCNNIEIPDLLTDNIY